MGTGIGVALSVMEGQPDPWKRLWDSFERSLRADTKVGKGWVSKRDGDVPRTIKTYREGGKVFHRFLIETGHDLDPKTITKPVVEDFIAKLRETAKDSTVHTRQAALRRFFNWLVDEEIIEKSPLAKIKMGKPDENSPDVLEDEEIVALVAAC